MSDAQLRALERAWLESGRPEDLQAYLRARHRAEALPLHALQTAAYLQDPLAIELLESQPAGPRPARTGVSRYLSELPGSEGTRERAGLALTRWLRDEREAEISPAGASCLDAALAWFEAPERSEALAEAARSARSALEAQFMSEPHAYFNPDYPVIANTYEVGPEDALDYSAWILARRAGGVDDALEWGDLARCLASAIPKGKATTAARDLVRAALLPWVFSGARAGGEHAPAPAPASLGPTARALSSAEDAGPSPFAAMTPALARVVLEAGAGAKKRPSVPIARAVVVAFLQAQGYRLVRGSLIRKEAGSRVKLLKTGLQIYTGQPGAWQRHPNSAGRTILLTDVAQDLLAGGRELDS